MATFTPVLTPTLRNPGTEGSLDTSILNGKSTQRTGYFQIYSESTFKIAGVKDGVSFTDTAETLATTPGLSITAS